MKYKKVLVIGIDGADPDYIQKGIEQGKMPTFSRLAKQGSLGKLKSTMPPLSMPAWPVIYTGKNPGKLGIYGFTELIPGSYEIDLANWKVKDSIWQILSKKRKKVAIINNYFTYPPDKVNGIMISAADNIKENCYYPKKLEQEIKEKVGSFDFDLIPEYYAIPEEKLTKLTKKTLKNALKLIEYTIKEYKWDLYFTTFNIDRIHHLYYDEESILKWYEEIDSLVSKVIKHVDKNTLILLFSDHGGGKLKKTFYINEFLKKHGFLQLSEKQYKNNFQKIMVGLGFSAENILNFIQKTKLDKLLLKIVPNSFWSFGKNRIPRKDFQFSKAKINWLKTKAFAPYSSTGGIYINLAGKHPYGIVKKQDYEKVREKIIKKFKKLNFKVDIYKKEEIYVGEFLEKAPDLTVLLDDYKYFPKNSFSGKLFTEPMTPGNHRPFGFIACSKKINLKDANVCDIVPTILNAFKLKVPKEVDGKSLL